MLDLTKQEKVILLFLSVTFVVGLGVRTYKQKQQNVQLQVASSAIGPLREQADSFIQKQRLVNINSLDINELSRLPGVGPKLGQRIIEYHRQHGAFTSKEQIMQVKGIGEKKFEQMKEMISLSPAKTKP